MENTPISIKGIVIPASWDANGSILTTAILTFDEDIFTVADTISGKALTRHLRKTVTATGYVVVQGASKSIQILNFNFHESVDKT